MVDDDLVQNPLAEFIDVYSILHNDSVTYKRI